VALVESLYFTSSLQPCQREQLFTAVCCKQPSHGMHLDQHPVLQGMWNLVARKVDSVVTMQLPADACQRCEQPLCRCRSEVDQALCSPVLSVKISHPDSVAYCVVLSLYCECGCVRYLGVFLVRNPASDNMCVTLTAT